MPTPEIPLFQLNYTDVGNDVVGESFQLEAEGIVTDATTARTLSATDNGKVLYFTSDSPITVTTAADLGKGFSCSLIQGGDGVITVAQGAGTTLGSVGDLYASAGKYAPVGIICPVADLFVLGGATA